MMMTASRKSAEGDKEKRAAKAKRKAAPRKKVEPTSDGHYIVIDGRRWRATDPSIPEAKRQRLVNKLMEARRDVGRALRLKDEDAERDARRRVNEAKVALGERGSKWWEKSKSKR